MVSNLEEETRERESRLIEERMIWRYCWRTCNVNGRSSKVKDCKCNDRAQHDPGGVGPYKATC